MVGTPGKMNYRTTEACYVIIRGKWYGSQTVAPQKGAIRASNRPTDVPSRAAGSPRAGYAAAFKDGLMKSIWLLVLLAAVATASVPQRARAQRAQYDALVATHAKANGVPEALVHR